MAQKKKDGGQYRKLSAAITAGNPGKLYIFHGEERYLLEHSLASLRSLLCPDGLSGFNYKRFEGGEFTPEQLSNAVDTVPAFADRTLIEVHDFDIFKGGDAQKRQLAELFSDLPDYACLVFIYNTVPFKPDNRQKLNKQLLEHAFVVEFEVQDSSKLVKWIIRHFSDAGVRINSEDAEYLAFITGGYMSALGGEIEKVAAFTSGKTVTRADIDAVVEPVPDAVAYKLTDAITRGDDAETMRILDELLLMREPPHKLMFSISLKTRQLLAARVCIENGLNSDAFMNMSGIKYPFQAKALFSTARKTTLSSCRDAVLACTETAFRLNNSSEPESSLIELIVQLAYNRKGAER